MIIKKDKHKLKTQLILAIKAFKGTPDFYFYDSQHPKQESHKYKLDDNDTEVLLMELGCLNWILITTKALFLGIGDTIARIDGANLDHYEFANQSDKKGLLSFERLNGDTKEWLYSGELIFVRKDRSEEKVVLPNHNFGYCLISAISKMKFMCSKYEGI